MVLGVLNNKTMTNLEIHKLARALEPDQFNQVMEILSPEVSVPFGLITEIDQSINNLKGRTTGDRHLEGQLYALEILRGTQK